MQSYHMNSGFSGSNSCRCYFTYNPFPLTKPRNYRTSCLEQSIMSLNKRMKTHLTQLKKKLHLKHSLNKDKKARTESQLWTEQSQGDGARKVLQHCPTSSCLWAATDSSIAHRTYWIVLVKVFISFLLSSPVGPGHPHLVFCHNLLCQLVECHMHMGFHFLCALLCWCRALLTHPVPPNDAGLSVRQHLQNYLEYLQFLHKPQFLQRTGGWVHRKTIHRNISSSTKTNQTNKRSRWVTQKTHNWPLTVSAKAESVLHWLTPMS